MLILAIDTSGKQGSVALCRGDASSFELLGLAALEGGTYSASLVPCIAELLQRADVTKSQIDGFVVVNGPGSFTGLRVGLSTVKAMCEVLQKPLATVSMLEALAITCGRDEEIVAAVLDAGRGEVYAGEYEVGGGAAKCVEDSMVKLSDFATKAVKSRLRVFTTFPKVVDLLGAQSELVIPLSADTIARIGLRKLLAGEVADAATLDANYIRRADAELYSPPKR